jgi:hypothetical protein
MGFALSVGATALIILLLLGGPFWSRPARPRPLTWDPGEPRSVAERMVRNG